MTISRIADDTPPPTRTVARIPDGQRDPAAVPSPRQPATNDALPPTTTTSPVATPVQRTAESADLPRTREIVAEPETAVGFVEPTGSVEAEPHRPDMAGSPAPLAPEPAAPIAMSTDVRPDAAARSDIRKPTDVVTPLPAVQRAADPEHASVQAIPEARSNSVIREPVSASQQQPDSTPTTATAPQVSHHDIGSEDVYEPPSLSTAQPGAPDPGLPRVAEIAVARSLDDSANPVVQRHDAAPPTASQPVPRAELPLVPVVPPMVALPEAPESIATQPSAVASEPLPSAPSVQRYAAEQSSVEIPPAIPAPPPITNLSRIEADAPVPAAPPRPPARELESSSGSRPSAQSTSASATVSPPQDIPMPVVQPIAADAPPSQPAQAMSPTVAASSPAQINPPRGRLVLLPPVQRTTEDGRVNPPRESHGPVIAESSRTMSLQRMFEYTARPAEPQPGHGPSDASAEPSASRSITFDPPVLQREAETPDAPAEPGGATPTTGAQPTPGGAAPGGGAAPTTDVQELVNRLYDPLAARLRAELWLDRERAGVLMNLHR